MTLLLKGNGKYALSVVFILQRFIWQQISIFERNKGSMVSYNPKEWFTYIFRIHRADTIRKLAPLLLGMAIYSAIIAFLELEFWNLSANSYVKGLPAMHSLLGFAISMLLVFRTNTAYDRWWEGRRLWGSLVNNSRNLALKLQAILPEEENSQRSFFRKIIPGYAFALHKHLHLEETRLELSADDEHHHVFKKIDFKKQWLINLKLNFNQRARRRI